MHFGAFNGLQLLDNSVPHLGNRTDAIMKQHFENHVSTNLSCVNIIVSYRPYCDNEIAFDRICFVYFNKLSKQHCMILMSSSCHWVKVCAVRMR